MSMRTMTGGENPYLLSYSAMADIVRRISDQPKTDLDNLFRWMTINVLVQNTDDHLQNFSMLHTAEGWTLSPGYDVTPNIYQERHILQINGTDGPFSREDILSEGRRVGLSAQKCRRLFDEVYATLVGWENVFDECGVPMEHTQKLRESIKQKRKRLA